MQKTILVTGGAGFIGVNLVSELLNRGDHVIVLDDFSTGPVHREIWPRDRSGLTRHRPTINTEWIRHDVLKPFTINCDEIYHLACPASPGDYQADPARTTRVAVEGTYNALQCAADVGARILIASTSEVYGEPTDHPQHESLWSHINPVGPRGCYDTGKAAAESIAVSFVEELGMEVRIARIHNTYGPFMQVDDGRLISNLICQALQGEILRLYGDGLQTRSLCYVDDMVDGLISLLENESLANGMPVNIGNPDERSVRNIAKVVAESVREKLVQPTSFNIGYDDLPEDDPTRRCPDIGFMNRVTGWTPTTSLRDGLSKTIDYYAQVLGIDVRR